MLIVAGSIWVDPADRDSYLAGCRQVVGAARAAAGCHDFALDADLLEPGRINIFERWESDGHLHAFRGSGPDQEQTVAITRAEVSKYRISSVEAP
ncbi:putative quinol monooxygenase [Plantactinospora sp. GCM10030261]|uniref:putative quinol monooxygenase n=1 Tax=Plantactinospora sp. GCM10030261 TaxID=3273420 RepID=UPI003611F3E0